MQLSLKKQSLFFLSLTFLSISSFCLKANVATEGEPQYQITLEEQQALLEPIKHAQENFLIGLEKTVQEIFLELNSGMKVAQEDAIREALLQCRNHIRAYHQQLKGMTVIEGARLDVTASFIKQMTSLLLSAVKTKFKTIPVFDATTVRSQSSIDEITLEDLQEKCQENESNLKKLQDKTTNLRLSLSNRFFRSSAKICSKVWPWVKYPSIVAITASYLACQLTSWKLHWLRNIKIPYFNVPLFGNSHLYHNRLIEQWEAGDNWEYLKSLKINIDAPDFNSSKLRRELQRIFPLGVSSTASTSMKWYNNDLLAQAAVTSLGTFAILSKLWGGTKKTAYIGSTRLMNYLKGYHDIEVKDDQYTLTSEITFDDVIGYEEVKEQLKMHILRFLENPERFTRLGLSPEKGWLFTGETRTGKTYMIEALRGEVAKLMKSLGKENQFIFKHFHSSVIVQCGLKLITEVLKQESPCTIIFIDEIDLLNLQRVGDNSLLADFLTTMSGFMKDKPDQQIFIIGATNKPETLDKSLRQHGRFGKEIRFEKPNFAHRREYLVKRFTELAIDQTRVDVDGLAWYTDGCVFEELESMICEAINRSQHHGIMITQELFEDALNRAVRNVVMDKSMIIAPQEHLMIAAHQMGTAIAHCLLQSREHVSLVTTRPIVATLKEETHWQDFYQSEEHKQKETIYGKVFTFKTEDSVGIETIDDKIIACKTLLAGYIAEQIMFGASSYSYQPENKFKAFQIAKELASKGISKNQLSDELNAKLTQTAWNTLEEYEKELAQLFEEFKLHLEFLTSGVMKQNVSGKQIMGILSMSKSELEDWLKQQEASEAPVQG